MNKILAKRSTCSEENKRGHINVKLMCWRYVYRLVPWDIWIAVTAGHPVVILFFPGTQPVGIIRFLFWGCGPLPSLANRTSRLHTPSPDPRAAVTRAALEAGAEDSRAAVGLGLSGIQWVSGHLVWSPHPGLVVTWVEMNFLFKPWDFRGWMFVIRA